MKIYVVVRTIVDQRLSIAVAAFMDEIDADNHVKLERELLKDHEWDESENNIFYIDEVELYD